MSVYRPTLKRPNKIRFFVKENKPSPRQVNNAIYEKLNVNNSVKCIADLDNAWFNITLDNERYCKDIATRGLNLNGMLIECERADVFNSIVVYVNAPYEMSVNVVANALMQYGTVANIRRQHHDSNNTIENGVRSLLIKHVKKPIPSFVKVGNFNLPVRHRGQQRTCKICQQSGHIARDCERRGRCFICGSQEHRTDIHEKID